ncbi:MAG: N-acetylglucosamine-6-phosphate deacetylase [Acutalibacteraceae bacterium]
MLLCGGTVYFSDGVRKNDLFIRAGRFAEQPVPNDTALDLTGLRVFPGLIDMHIHGFRGHYSMDEDTDSLRDFAAELVRYGVTSFLPTTTAAPPAVLLNTLSRLKSVSGDSSGAVIRGIYMEGPFLSPAYKGAMREDCLCVPDTALAEAFQEASGGLLKVMAVAPELEGAQALIRWCVSKGIQPSIAHTAADYDTACTAMRAGADHITHLFNAMADPRHRQPGVFGAALDSGSSAEIIADGHHVHPAFLRMAYRLLGPERLILISDDTPISGCGDGSFLMDGRTSIVKDGICRLSDGTINGNVQPLLTCVLRAEQFGIPLADAVRMASETPAKKLGIYKETGSIAPGKSADLFVLDEQNRVRLTMVGGNIVYNALG